MALGGIALDPAETALIVVDMQNGFCHPEGSLGQARGAESVDKPRQIIPNIVRAIVMCRSFGIPIWFTRQVHYEGDAGRARHRVQSHLDRGGVHLELCWRGSWDTELVDEVAALVRPDDEIIIKHRASGFYNTPLEVELRMKEIQVLIITGTTTSYCVESTIRDAYARDFDIVVPTECVADREEAAQQATLNSVERFHGAVTTLDELATSLHKGQRKADVVSR